jgi:predicted sugar kinase
MSTREKILSAITANKPTMVALPVMDMQQVTNYDDLVAKFTATLHSIGGQVLHLENMNMLDSIINEEIKIGKLVYNAMGDLSGELSSNQGATALEHLLKQVLA